EEREEQDRPPYRWIGYGSRGPYQTCLLGGGIGVLEPYRPPWPSAAATDENRSPGVVRRPPCVDRSGYSLFRCPSPPGGGLGERGCTSVRVQWSYPGGILGWPCAGERIGPPREPGAV